MQTMWVGTRKGLFVVRRTDAGWRIGKPRFPGEPVTQFVADPKTGAWYAALRLGHFGVKMWKSLDQGTNWNEVAAPAFPPKPTEGVWKDDETPWSVDLVWGLEAGSDGRLWAGCIPAGLFVSDDGAASWRLVDSLWERPEPAWTAPLEERETQLGLNRMHSLGERRLRNVQFACGLRKRRSRMVKTGK